MVCGKEVKRVSFPLLFLCSPFSSSHLHLLFILSSPFFCFSSPFCRVMICVQVIIFDHLCRFWGTNLDSWNPNENKSMLLRILFDLFLPNSFTRINKQYFSCSSFHISSLLSFPFSLSLPKPTSLKVIYTTRGAICLSSNPRWKPFLTRRRQDGYIFKCSEQYGAHWTEVGLRGMLRTNGGGGRREKSSDFLRHFSVLNIKQKIDAVVSVCVCVCVCVCVWRERVQECLRNHLCVENNEKGGGHALFIWGTILLCTHLVFKVH